SDLDPALPSVWQASGKLVAYSPKPDIPHELLGAGFRARFLGLVGLGPEDGLHRALPEPGVRADHDVLHHSHPAEEPDVLEGARHVESGHLLGDQAVYPPTFEAYRALLGLVEARQRVEEGRLTCAVGSDDGIDATGFHREAHLVDRGEPAEALDDVLRLEDQGGISHDLPPSTRLGRMRRFQGPRRTRPSARACAEP